MHHILFEYGGEKHSIAKLTIRLLTILSLQQEHAMYMSKKQCLQEMPLSMISAILQKYDITFTITSIMIRTYDQT
jgi:hypothetical protein